MLATVSGALVRQTCAKKRFRCLSVASCSPSGGWSAVELRKARRAAKFSLELISAEDGAFRPVAQSGPIAASALRDVRRPGN